MKRISEQDEKNGSIGISNNRCGARKWVKFTSCKDILIRNVSNRDHCEQQTSKKRRASISNQKFLNKKFTILKWIFLWKNRLDLWFLVAIGHTQAWTKGIRQSIGRIKNQKVLHSLENYFGVWDALLWLRCTDMKRLFFSIFLSFRCRSVGHDARPERFYWPSIYLNIQFKGFLVSMHLNRFL